MRAGEGRGNGRKRIIIRKRGRKKGREGERRKSGRHTPRWWKQDVDGRIGPWLRERERARAHAKLIRRSIEKERKTWWGESGPRRTGATTPSVRSATPRTHDTTRRERVRSDGPSGPARMVRETGAWTCGRINGWLNRCTPMDKCTVEPAYLRAYDRRG